ncbi:hypothetical protein WA026_000440 [Henosepilachna vigintioctopunctata]|uniref:Solute-binding protein family 3/N-terminal domain-containing protein n=1 Tax=Henosepilachna vigintioctopunctata TaxID=420089 RepID=A0AAW1V562_9CUCU
MLLPITIIKNYIFFDCINRFLTELWTNDSSVLLVNFDGHFNQPVTRFTYGHQKNTFEHIKPSIYVIKSEAGDLKNVLHHLEMNTFFNPRAQFLLVVEKIEQLIFEILADFFVHEVVVMEQGKDGLINLYSYEPYQNSSFNVSPCPILIGSCIEGIIRYETVPRIIPNSQGLLPLKVGCSNSIPSMILQDGVPTSGVDFELLKLISEKLGVQLQYTVVSDFVGRKDDSTNFFDGALGALAKREVDLVVGGVFPTWQGLSSFDFTHPTVVNDYAWIVPAPNKRPLWKSLVFTFRSVVWILYFNVFFISLTILIFANKVLTLKSVNWFRELVMLYTTCLTSSGVNWKLELHCKKMVYILWLLMNFIYSGCFSAKLLSNLVMKKYEDRMNLVDIETSDIKICIYTDLIEKLNHFEEERLLTCVSCEVCVNRTAFQRDLISVRSRILLIYGLIIAFAAFIFELIIAKMKRRKCDTGKDTTERVGR